VFAENLRDPLPREPANLRDLLMRHAGTSGRESRGKQRLLGLDISVAFGSASALRRCTDRLPAPEFNIRGGSSKTHSRNITSESATS
jgi:hypothetical protein